MVERTESLPEALLPSSRYGDILQQIPALYPTFKVVDQVVLEEELSTEAADALTTYSIWAHAPEEKEQIVKLFQITPTVFEDRLEYVSDNLEAAIDKMEELEEARDEEDEESFKEPVSLPITVFEPPQRVGKAKKTRVYNLGLIDREDVLFERVREILPDHYWSYARLGLEGKDTTEIAETLGVSYDAVRSMQKRIRKVVEQEIIFPAGYKRARSTNRSITVLAGLGQREATNILGIWYINDATIHQHELTARKVDPSVLERGLEPVFWHIPSKRGKSSNPDHRWVLSEGKKRGLIEKYKGIYYMTPTDIAMILAERSPSVAAA